MTDLRVYAEEVLGAIVPASPALRAYAEEVLVAIVPASPTLRVYGEEVLVAYPAPPPSSGSARRRARSIVGGL